ncbi:hypothetical protein [Jannaschia sp. W003]|uniref:hypothetical protein n=1 Tax=Jannaschia sp. W003 TaxID=2867012 RepID=UPI0021A3BD50|nr:hypothetical protein [Jannaschia sp. W003]UWQ22036.1 hypothetical protein K3554_03125 [Jannaschia sp. W003]
MSDGTHAAAPPVPPDVVAAIQGSFSEVCTALDEAEGEIAARLAREAPELVRLMGGDAAARRRWIEEWISLAALVAAHPHAGLPIACGLAHDLAHSDLGAPHHAALHDALTDALDARALRGPARRAWSDALGALGAVMVVAERRMRAADARRPAEAA